MRTTFPQQIKVVEILPPAADAAGRTGDYIDVSGFRKVALVCHITQGNAATVALTPRQATSSGGANTKALSVATPIWVDLDTAASDLLVRATDAVSYTTDAGVKNKIVIFEIDTAQLDINNGFRWVTVLTGASNAANITQVMAYGLDGRLEQAQLPSVI